MESTTSRKKTETRPFRVHVPDEELRTFICCSDSTFGEKGFFSEGWTSPGPPDTCPYTAFQLGAFERRGKGPGELERAGECLRAWKQVGREHQEVLVAYYLIYDLALTTPEYWDKYAARAMPIGVTKRLYEQFQQLAWVAVVLARRENRYQELVQPPKGHGIGRWLQRSQEANRVAHTVWADIRSRVERKSEVLWQTGRIGA